MADTNNIIDFTPISAQLPVNPSKWSIIPIHSSDRATFKFCRRQWVWSSPSHLNLIRKASVLGIEKNLWFGTGIHYALERYYNPMIKDDPAIAWEAWFDLQWRGGIVAAGEVKQFADREPITELDGFGEPTGYYRVAGLIDVLPDSHLDEEFFLGLKDLGIGMMKFYKDYAEANDNFSVILVEHDFSVPVLNSKGEPLYAVDNRLMPDGWEPDLNAGNEFGPYMREHALFSKRQGIDDSAYYVEKQVHVRGRMDLIIQEMEHGRYGIWDHKTTSRLDDDYFRHLELDEQCTCVSMNSQALTPSGWKYRDELEVGDLILAFDEESDNCYWVPILHITDGIADLYDFGNTQGTFNVKVTANHNWVGRRRVGAGRSDEHWNPWRVRTDQLPTSHGKIRLAALAVSDGSLDITEEEAELLGWILSDGHFSIRNGQLRVSIAQALHKYVDDVEMAAANSGYSYSTRVDKSKLSDRPYKTWNFSSPEMKILFESAGIKSKTQDLTKFILGMTIEARSRFCEAALKAEGTANLGSSKSERLNWFCQKSGNLKNAFRLAFFLNGNYTTIGSEQGFGLKIDQEIDSRTLKSSLSESAAKVWCPTTKLGTWVMRQGDQICITGNSYLSFAQLEARLHNLEFKELDFIEYQALLKGYPKPPTPLKDGTPSLSRTTETTTAKLFEQYILENGLKPIFDIDTKMQNYYAWLLEIGDARFIQRTQTWRNHAQRQNAMTRLYYEAKDMLDPNMVAYPNPSKNYSCLNCIFRAPCIMAESGDDYLRTLEDAYMPNWNR